MEADNAPQLAIDAVPCCVRNNGSEVLGVNVYVCVKYGVSDKKDQKETVENNIRRKSKTHTCRRSVRLRGEPTNTFLDPEKLKATQNTVHLVKMLQGVANQLQKDSREKYCYEKSSHHHCLNFTSANPGNPCFKAAACNFYEKYLFLDIS